VQYSADGITWNPTSGLVTETQITLSAINIPGSDSDSVKETAVVSQKDRLIAYVIPDSMQSLPSDWRSYFIDHLSDYMIPTNLMAMEDFPRTPNGKLDRKALPVPESDRTSKAFIAPTTKTEKALAEIWEEILGVEKVGIHDNFFDMGGDSLISI
jgi:hypothetical protein